MEDFQDYEFLKTRVREFVTNTVKCDFELLATQIIQAIEQKEIMAAPTVSVTKSTSTAERSKHLRKTSLSSIASDMLQNLHVRRPSLSSFLSNPSESLPLYLDFEPNEFGRQLTLLEFDLYSKIPSHELLDQMWEGKILHETASYPEPPATQRRRTVPGSSLSAISALIQHTNDVYLCLILVYILGCNDSSQQQIFKETLSSTKAFHSSGKSLQRMQQSHRRDNNHCWFIHGASRTTP